MEMLILMLYFYLLNKHYRIIDAINRLRLFGLEKLGSEFSTLQIVLKGVLKSTASASATATTPMNSVMRWQADVDLVVNLIGLDSTVKVSDLIAYI